MLSYLELNYFFISIQLILNHYGVMCCDLSADMGGEIFETVLCSVYVCACGEGGGHVMGRGGVSLSYGLMLAENGWEGGAGVM